jgi:hypothetical protein
MRLATRPHSNPAPDSEASARSGTSCGEFNDTATAAPRSAPTAPATTGVFRPRRESTTRAGKPNTTPITRPTGVPTTAATNTIGSSVPPRSDRKAATEPASRPLLNEAFNATVVLARRMRCALACSHARHRASTQSSCALCRRALPTASACHASRFCLLAVFHPALSSRAFQHGTFGSPRACSIRCARKQAKARAALPQARLLVRRRRRRSGRQRVRR